MNSESKENIFSPNLLTNLDQTVELIKAVEGEVWYRSSLGEVKALADKIKKLEGANIDPGTVVGSFYGNGGITRWMVTANGDVKFSTFHDTGDEEKNKTKKAEALGFKLI